MTNDKQVEVWRAEFEATVDKPHLLQKFPSGHYHWDSTEWMWVGFQRAKRSMQPIELPDIEDCWVYNHENYYCAIKYENKIKAILSAAGYSYRVKE